MAVSEVFHSISWGARPTPDRALRSPADHNGQFSLRPVPQLVAGVAKRRVASQGTPQGGTSHGHQEQRQDPPLRDQRA